jgi:hypothetical protein
VGPSGTRQARAGSLFAHKRARPKRARLRIHTSPIKEKPPGFGAGRFVKEKESYFFFLPEFFIIARDTLPFLSMK